MDSGHKLTPRLFFGLVAGLALAVLAFSQAAASIGIAIEGFRPLGGGFFFWRAGQRQMAMSLVEQDKRIDPAAVSRSGRNVLIYAPLNTRSLWLVGKGREMQKDVVGARRAMLQAERISRRDGAVQLWLGVDSLRSNSIAPGLRHFDLLLRSDTEAAATLMPRLALILLSPDGRREIAPYIRASNPWLVPLLNVAVSDLPQAAPVAQLLVDRKRKAPDLPELRDVYGQLVSKLVAQRSYRLALQLYPLLPRADVNSLKSVDGMKGGRLDEGYSPFIWDLSVSDAQGAAFVSLDKGRSGLDIFGAPGTVGIAASKLIAPDGNDSLRWIVSDKEGNLDGSAIWEANCLLGRSAGEVRRSINLTSAEAPLNRAMVMALPADCELLRLDMRIAGGIGRTPSRLVVGDLKLTRAAVSR